MIKEFFAAIAISIWGFFGFTLTSLFVYHSVDVVTRTAIGIPVGIIIYTWIIFVLNVKYKFSLLLGWSVTLIIGFISVIFYLIKPKGKTPKAFARDYMLLYVGIPTVFICFLMKITFLYKGNITRGATYGDFPFHMNIISSFVYGCNSERKSLWDLTSPFFANVELAYPVLVNFLSSILIGCFGLKMPEAILYPSLPMVFSIMTLLNQIVGRFTKNRFSCIIAPWIFIFLGGRGFLNIFDEKARSDFAADFVHTWGNDKYGYWLQTIMHVMFPQRLSLFGMPLSFSFLAIMERAKFKSVLPYLFCGLLVALMPQVQAHACIAAFEWTLAYAAINFPWRKPKEWWTQLRCYFSLAIPAFMLALPQLIPFTKRAGDKGFFSLKPIWVDDRINFFDIWWNGLFIFWAISIFIGPFFLNKDQFREYVPALFVFVVSNLVHYQPWNMDNSKVFYAGWIPLAIAVVANYYTFLLIHGNSFIESIAFVLLLSSMASGVMCIYSGISYGAPQWNPYEDVYGFAKEVIDKTEPKSVWATDSFHDHPVATLAGRQILIGYRGWLNSHHLHDGERLNALYRLCLNPDDTTWADKNNVTYVCYHKTSHQEISRDFNTSKKWNLHIDFDAWKVYKRNNVK